MQTTKDFQAVLSAISHEVRNPVTLINSYLQLLAKNHPEICGTPYWINILSEMSHLKDLLNDLTAYQNGSRLALVPTNLNAYLGEYAELLAPLLSQKPYVTFTYDAADPLPEVSVDRHKLRQVLDNLVRNALEAIEEALRPADVSAESEVRTADVSAKSEVRAADVSAKSEARTAEQPALCLRADVWEKFVRITVRDNGCGIDDDFLETIFDPFVTHKPDGTGLGLAIAQQIILAHGGRLICSSKSQPTEFQILLPAQTRPENRPDGQSDPRRSP